MIRTLLFIAPAAGICLAEPIIPGAFLADPHAPVSGLLFQGTHPMVEEGTLRVKLGRNFRSPWLTLGGLLEVGNDPRFNQGMLPNHNWRGVLALEPPLWNLMRNRLPKWTSMSLGLSFWHESAHGTQGIIEETSVAHEKIYDGQWRSLNMNSLNLDIVTGIAIPRLSADLRLRYHRFFRSRNQPEITNLDLAESGGYSVESQCVLPLGRWGLFASHHLGFVMKSEKEVMAQVWADDFTGEARQRWTFYPVINDTWDQLLKLGCLRDFEGYQASLFAQWQAGHPGGFVDSRNIHEHRWGLGLEIR